MTNGLKTRLQKLIDAVKNEDINEFWSEFSTRMKAKQQKITLGFQVTDEVYWQSESGILHGTIIEIINQTTCRVRQDNVKGTTWRIASTLLTKNKEYLKV